MNMSMINSIPTSGVDDSRACTESSTPGLEALLAQLPANQRQVRVDFDWTGTGCTACMTLYLATGPLVVTAENSFGDNRKIIDELVGQLATRLRARPQAAGQS